MHAHPEDSRSRHEEFVKKLSGAGPVVRVTMNMNGIAKPTTWLSSAPMIPKRLIELQRSRQVRPKKLAAAIITGMTDQLKTIGWLNSTTVGISREEEATE